MTRARTNADNVTADIAGITAGTGITGGGTSGTVTVTNSMATAFDTKGDLVAATGSDAFSKLAVGANGTVLTAASGEATGLSWATPSSGSLTLLSTTTLTGSSTTISSINQTHTNLLILITDAYGNSNNEILTISFNAAANSHDTAIYRNDTGSLSGATTFNTGSFEASKFDDSSGAGAQSCVINVYDYTSVGVKPYNSSSAMQNTSSSSNNGSFTTGRFRQASAISSIVLAPSGGTFSAGTVRIYGVK